MINLKIFCKWGPRSVKGLDLIVDLFRVEFQKINVRLGPRGLLRYPPIYCKRRLSTEATAMRGVKCMQLMREKE